MSTPLAHDVRGASDAPVLVLGSSLGTTREMWDPQLDAFAARFRVVRFEHPGHGGSSSPAPGAYDVDELGRDVLALLDSLGLSTFSYAGVSLGGMVGVWLAARVPQRVRRLVICCSSAHPDAASRWRARAKTVRESGLVAIRDEVLAGWFTPAWAAAHDAQAQRFGADLTQAVQPAGYAACCDALSGLDLRPALPAIVAPTLVVAGADDHALPVPHSRLLADTIAGARLEVIADAAHLATVERPDLCTPLLLDHLLPATGGDS